MQVGEDIEFLGLTIDARGAGRLHCPDVKGRGMQRDIELQQRPLGAGRKPTTRQLVSGAKVERLVGRLGNLAQIEPAAGAQMPPLYRMERVTRPPMVAGGRRQRPGKLAVWGDGPAQAGYQQSLAWWSGAFDRGLEVPLAPQRVFPALDEPGVLAVFSDAASEHGTGLGAFAPLWYHGEASPVLLFAEERWSPAQQMAFDEGKVSMPMGELYGGVVFLVALIAAHPEVRAVYWFTDCDAAKAAVNSNSSPSPQMNRLLSWLFQRSDQVQILALHVPGKRNWASDGLSRNGVEGASIAEVLESAWGAGMLLRRLPPTDDCEAVFAEAAALQQSARAAAGRKRRRARR